MKHKISEHSNDLFARELERINSEHIVREAEITSDWRGRGLISSAYFNELRIARQERVRAIALALQNSQLQAREDLRVRLGPSEIRQLESDVARMVLSSIQEIQTDLRHELESNGLGVVAPQAIDAVARDLQVISASVQRELRIAARQRGLFAEEEDRRRESRSIPERGVFLCHASEDKDSIVRPLAAALEEADISCWIDEAEVRWGDSLTEKINAGHRSAQYVVAIISRHFLGKNWPEKELGAALNQEISTGQVRLLALIVGNEEHVQAVQERYPLLRDKLYLVWKDAMSTACALKERLSS